MVLNENIISNENIMFDVHTGKLVALVIDGSSDQFGELGKLDKNFQRRYGLPGTWGITFSNGKYEQFWGINLKEKIKFFYKDNNETGRKFDKINEGPNSLKETFLSLEAGSLENLSEKYEGLFNESFNYHFRPSDKTKSPENH